MWAFNWGLFIPEYLATVSLIMLADGIVVDFVAMVVVEMFGEAMINSAVSMFAYSWGERYISQPAFLQYSFFLPANKRVMYWLDTSLDTI